MQVVPGQRQSEVQQRATALRQMHADAMRQQSAIEATYDLIAHERATYVPGRGNLNPRVVFISERPSRADAATRAPLSGRAGVVFDRLLVGLGMTRNDVYATHLVPWYPPNDRATTEAERNTCGPWLRQELVILGRPPVVLLGRGTSEHLLVQPYEKLLGEWRYAPGLRAFCLSVRHPAYAVYQDRNYEPMAAQYQRILDHPSEITNAAF